MFLNIKRKENDNIDLTGLKLYSSETSANQMRYLKDLVRDKLNKSISKIKFNYKKIAIFNIYENQKYLVKKNNINMKLGKYKLVYLKSVAIIFSQEKENNITIGRSLHNDFFLKDFTISKEHCILHYNEVEGEEGFYIMDKNSKFGTLRLIKKGDQIKI
jgi:hypothetical protein